MSADASASDDEPTRPDGIADPETLALRQCLRAYDRDPANFRAWLCAKLGVQESTAAE